MSLTEAEPALDSPPADRAAGAALATFAGLIARLRAPDGCPWDREQTHLSLRPFLLEESYEVLDALDAGDPARLREEMGDLLLQVVLHAQIAAESGDFTLAEVIDAISAKIVRRHPHVFGEVRADTADEVRANWAAIKADEKAAQGAAADPFAGIPAALPALARAQAVQAKAPRTSTAEPSSQPGSPDTADDVGLADDAGDTGESTDLAIAFDRASAEAAAVRQAHDAETRSRAIGLLLWQAVGQAASWDVDAETALRETIARFLSTFEGAPA